MIDLNVLQSMGVTDSKAVINKIESQFKSLRKYCDPVYGQITVIQNKTSKRSYAMIEKSFLKASTTVQNVLNRESSSQYFLKLERYQTCDLSMCSDIRLYFFLFEYAGHTLEQEIGKRNEIQKQFTKQQAYSLLLQQIQIALALRSSTNPETGRTNKYLLSNNNYLCSPFLELRTLQPIFKLQPQVLDESAGCYLSPQAYQMLQRGESYRVRQFCRRQSSIIFSMGLNFLQCLLLADLSNLYEEKGLDFYKLSSACQQVRESYGEDIYQMIKKMVNKDENERISLDELKKIIKGQKKNRKSNIRLSRQESIEIY